MMSKPAAWIDKNKWFVLACCFLVVNVIGMHAMSSRVRPHATPSPETDAKSEKTENPAAPSVLPQANAATDSKAVQPVTPLRITDIRINSPSYADASIRVRFSHQIEAAALRRALSLTPAAGSSIEVHSERWTGHYADISGGIEKGASYTLAIEQGLASTDGKAVLKNRVERTISIPDATAAIRIRMQGRYLSPAGALLLPLESVNIDEFKLSAARIPAVNLVQYAMREGRHYAGYYGAPGSGIGVPAGSRSFSLQTPLNKVTEHAATLRDVLPDDPRGAYVIELRHGTGRPEQRLVVVTDTGISVKQSEHELLVWVNSLHSLAAVGGATVKTWSSAAELLAEGRTDPNGLVRLPVGSGDENAPFMVTVANGNDLSFLSLPDARLPGGSQSGASPYVSDGYEAFLHTDRGVYRPGETAHLRAIVRGKGLSLPPEFPVVLEIRRPDGRRHSVRQALLSESGTAEFRVAWNDYDATGRYTISLKTPGGDDAMGSITLAVEDFVPPRIAAELVSDQQQYAPGETGRLTVVARYLYGAPAYGNPVSARLTVHPIAFTSEHFPQYVFGDPERSMAELSKDLGRGNLNPYGAGSFPISIPDEWQPPAMLRGLLSTTIIDQGGRTVTAFTGCDIHPYPFYLGLRTGGMRGMRPGDAAQVGIVMAKTDGTPKQEQMKLELTLYTVRWTTVLTTDSNGRHRYQSQRNLNAVYRQTLETGPDGRVVYDVRAGNAGYYLLRVADNKSNVSSSHEFYVGGSHDRWQTRSMEQPGRVEMALDREYYRPGDIAMLRITAPFHGKALLTLEQDRVLSATVKNMEANTAVFEIPVTAEMWPNVHAAVSVIRKVEPSSLQQVYRATGALALRLDSSDNRLRIDLDAPGEIRPGSRLEVGVKTIGPDGKGRQTEFTLAAVDEAICSLTDFTTPDPLDFFSALRRNSVSASDLYAMLLGETEDEIIAERSHTGGDLARLLRGRLNPVRSRRFKPLALWHGTQTTDADGNARVVFDIPEFSGEIRLMAVAVDDRHFGSAQRQVTVRRPFTVLTSLPRFMAPGDVCTMPVEIHNNFSIPVEAVLKVSTTGPVETDHDDPVIIRLASGERGEYEFRLQALNMVGTANIRIVAFLNGEEFADEIELAVRPAAGRTVLHGTVALAPNEQRIIELPEGWMNDSAKYALQFSARPAVKLKGALDYLLNYPYGCLEQTVSASIPALYWQHLDVPPQSSIYIVDSSHLAEEGVRKVLAMQLANGAFSLWPNTNPVYEYGTVYALDFLIMARKNGLDVPDERIEAGLGVLRQYLSRPVKGANDLEGREWREDIALRAYACQVLADAGQPRHDWSARLLEQTDHMPKDSRLRLVMALIAGGRRRDAWNELQAINSMPVSETRMTGGSLASPSRTAALRLMAWAELAPDDPRTVVAMQALEDHMGDGHWFTTQDNAMAIRAFAHYMQQGTHDISEFNGRFEQGETAREVSSADRQPVHVLPDGSPVIVHNDGPGTMYVAWNAEGIPLHQELAETAEGISVRREFLDLQGMPLEENRAAQGDLMIVRLTVDTRGRSVDNLVVEELLAAGLEIENANLKTSQTVRWAAEQSNLPVRHADIRDDRLVVFADAFSGTRQFYYAVRAVTPGEYTLPHVAAEAMYDPRINGRSGGGRFSVDSR